jgi:hypothetical protein
MANIIRQEFLDLLDSIGTSLDNANSDIDCDLRDAVNDSDAIMDRERDALLDVLDRWDSFYTDFNIVYEMAQGMR